MPRIKYVGESFGAVSLTDGKVYVCQCQPDDYGFLRVVDDSGEDYIYSPTDPAPLDGSSKGGHWEIIEDYADGRLKALIAM